ncbi:MAG TPA: VWA domain-containing protein [Steroidobacteraceae bacterium]|nr:VWA domain-containing protein [Steroidobacteraceae bacterium]
MRRWIPLLLTFLSSAAFAQASVNGPANAKAGAAVQVTVAGSKNPRDFVTIVEKTASEGAYGGYEYVTKPGAFKLIAPPKSGDYEIRLLSADSPYPTLARRPLRIDAVEATLDAPAQVAAGATFSVKWTGPNNERDYVAYGDASRPYIGYEYTKAGSPLELTAPDDPGQYELRYFLAAGDTIIARRPISVGAVSASVTAPQTAAAGAKIKITWQGPNNARDFVTIVKASTADKQYAAYEYTSQGSTLEMRAPDVAGEYEVRYLTAQTYATLATAKMTVTAVSASIKAPATAVAGSNVAVTWQGPNNERDYVTIVKKGAREGDYATYEYTARGNPVKVLAPVEPGDYEVRYSTGAAYVTLARAPITITPAKEEPGTVEVVAASALPAGSAVEIILDASGSMLQKIGKERRIDIARQTLTKLVTSTIPAGTPFAFRVFGRMEDSCQSDLDVPLGPLNVQAVSAKLGGLEPKNGAKTAIGASLELVASDLRSVQGERLVILLTDGEETCGGDPAAAIEKLKKASTKVRVNIVGLAIDDASLAATFRHWADAGNGMYFDTQGAAALNEAMAKAMRPSFEIVNAQGAVVGEGLAGGDPVRVIAGNYTVRLAGGKGAEQSVTVKAKEKATVKFQ